MIVKLFWKEFREQYGIWLALVVLIGLFAYGSKIMGPRHPGGMGVSEWFVLALALTYGVVCGGMMLAGERENNTLTFLDVFHGNRAKLWCHKAAVGVVFVLTHAFAVAWLLTYVNFEFPLWPQNAFDFGARGGGVTWFEFLPIVAIEAYAWGLLGSSIADRVLVASAIALVGVVPASLLTCLPPVVGLPLRFIGAAIALVVSVSAFTWQSRDTAGVWAPPEPPRPFDPRERFVDDWDRFQKEDDDYESPYRAAHDVPIPSLAIAEWVPESPATPTIRIDVNSSDAAPEQPSLSAGESLRWLTWQQMTPTAWLVMLVALMVGLLGVAGLAYVWPIATLVLGVTCGCAAFASEQSDLTYQFLAAQRIPPHAVWRHKLFAWSFVAVVSATLVFMAFGLTQFERRQEVNRPFQSLLLDQMGRPTYAGVWLAYGFAVGQLCVWLTRKALIAAVVSFLVAGLALGLWLPAVLCGGAGWPMWVPPAIFLAASWCLVRAWLGGRISERRPLAALAGFGGLVLLWAVICGATRAWAIPDVGAPLDVAAFRAEVQANANAAGKNIQQALIDFDNPAPGQQREGKRWNELMAEIVDMPVGVLDVPRADGNRPQALLKSHQRMIDTLSMDADAALLPGRAADVLAQVLAYSRTLGNKASVENYLAGVNVEAAALNRLQAVVGRIVRFNHDAPKEATLRAILKHLDHHAAETPPAIDCLRTECFLATGLVDVPSAWTFRGVDGNVVEPGMAQAIALSMEMPSEAARKTRLWRLVWAGLLEAGQTPHWRLPKAEDLRVRKPATGVVMKNWMSPAAGPAASIDRAAVARLLDESWLADEKLFCPVARVHDVATRSQCRVDATRLMVATCLYRVIKGRLPDRLDELVPNTLPALPVDPYTGAAFHFDAAIAQPPRHLLLPINPGDAILWSAGPDGAQALDRAIDRDLIVPIPR